MARILLKGHILVEEKDLAAVLQELRRHIELTRQEEGCLVFDVMQNSDNKNIFNVYEEFIDSAAFTLHQQRVANSAWGKVTRNVERHYQVTEVD